MTPLLFLAGIFTQQGCVTHAVNTTINGFGDIQGNRSRVSSDAYKSEKTKPILAHYGFGNHTLSDKGIQLPILEKGVCAQKTWLKEIWMGDLEEDTFNTAEILGDLTPAGDEEGGLGLLGLMAIGDLALLTGPLIYHYNNLNETPNDNRAFMYTYYGSLVGVATATTLFRLAA